MAADPYATLGLTAGASEAEIRTAYRRLAMLHHPDHNAGSPESAVRFAEVQEAYAHVLLMRRRDATAHASPAAPRDSGVEARIAEMERELATARALREQASRRAQRAARLRDRTTGRRPASARPSDEELGYVSTEDSFTRILDDFAQGLSQSHPAPAPAPAPARPRSVADWIDELSARLTGEDR